MVSDGTFTGNDGHMSSPSVPPSPAVRRRRVRSGCLTCRGRRRKCDEAKPTCNACLARNLSCSYETRLKFVHTVQSSTRRSTRATNLQSSATSAPALATAAPGNLEDETTNFRSPSPAVFRNTPADVGSVPVCDAHLHEASAPARAIPSPVSASSAYQYQSPRSNYIDSTTRAMPELGSTHSDITELGGVERLDLLSFYRYHVGPVLDLDPITPYWSSELLHQSGHYSCVFHAIMEVSNCIQNRVEGRFHETFRSDPLLSTPETGGSRELNFPAQLLLVWRSMLFVSPSEWLSVLYRDGAYLIDGQCPARCRGWWVRLVLASQIATDPANLVIPESALSPDPHSNREGVPSSSMAQLADSCAILQRACTVLRDILRPTNLPIGSIWQYCWSAAQVWYATRTVEMEQILELTDLDVLDSSDGTAAIFPPIVFSNSSATLANVAHHMCAMLLLQAKPRLTKVAAERGSSISLSWHVLRILRIGAAAVEDGFWDPLLATAIIKAGRNLSHASQLGAVVKILERLMAISGMQLQSDVEYFLRAATS